MKIRASAVGDTATIAGASAIPIVGQAAAMGLLSYDICKESPKCMKIINAQLKRDAEYVRNLNHQVYLSSKKTHPGFLTPQLNAGAR